MFVDKGELLDKKEDKDVDLKEKLLYDGETFLEKEEKKKEYVNNTLNE